MPIYKLNGNVYDIPDDVVADFEKDNPNATISYHSGSDEYDIPVSQREAFLKDFPDATAGNAPASSQSPGSTKQPMLDAVARENAGGYQPSAAEMAEFQKTINGVGRTVSSSVASFDKKAENLRKRQGFNAPKEVKVGESGNLVEGEKKLNPETGQLESTYITAAGNQYDNKAIADEEQRNIDKSLRDERYRQSLPGQIEDTIAEGKRLDSEIAKLREGAHGRLMDAMYGGRTGEDADLDSRLSALLAAKRKNDERLKILEAERDDDGGTQFWRGFYDAITNPDVYSFGVTGLSDATQMLKLKQKIDDAQKRGVQPEFTEEEKSLIQNVEASEYAQQVFGRNRGSMYSFGSGFAQSLPFMFEIAATGGMGGLSEIGFAAGRKAATKLATAAVEKSMIRNLGKGGKWIADMAVKGSGALGGVTGGGLIMANTTGAAKTSADIIDRYVGKLVRDNAGDLKFEDGASLGEAIYKGQLAQAFEYGSELVGDKYIERFMPVIGDAVKRTIGKIGSENARNFLEHLMTNKFTEGMGKVMKSRYFEKGEKALNFAGVQGWFAEGMEEEANNILNAIFVGDTTWMKQDPNKPAILSTKDQLELWEQTILTSALLRAPQTVQTAGKAAGYYGYKYATDAADANAASVFGENNWQMIKEEIDKCTNEDLPALLETVVKGGMSQKQKEATMYYADNLLKMRGYNGALAADGFDTGKDEVDELIDDLLERGYQQGHQAELPDDQKAVADNARKAEADLKQYGDEFAIMVTAGNDHPGNTLRYMMEHRDIFTDDQIAAAQDYYQKKVASDAMMDAALEKIDLSVSKNTADIRSNTHTDSGQVITATDGTNTYYVLGGGVDTADDGSLRLVGTGGAMTVKDANTGDIKVMSPASLAVVSAANSDELVQNSEQTLKEQLVRQADDAMEYGSPANEVFQSGEMVTLRDRDGSIIEGQVIVPESVDGQFQVITSDNKSHPYSFDDLNLMIVSHNGQPVQRGSTLSPESDQVSDQVPENAETGTDINENVPEGQINGQINQPEIPAEEVQQPESQQNGKGEETEQPQSAASRIPLDENNQPDYIKAKPEDSYDALVEEMGEEDANTIIASELADAQKRLSSLQKKQPQGSTIEEKKRSLAERRAAMEEEQNKIDYWNSVLEIPKARKAEAERKAAEEELRRAEEERMALMQTPEGRQQLLSEAGNSQERAAVAKEIYGDYFNENIGEPDTVEELVSLLLPYGKLNWEGYDRGTSHVRGLQEELGSGHSRGLSKDRGTSGFNSYLAKKGEGESLDDIVHSMYEDDSNLSGGEHRFTTEEIKDAVIGMLLSAEKPRDIRDYTLNSRIATAERTLRAEQEAEAEDWADFYHLNPEEREAFEAYMQQQADEFSALSDDDIREIISIFADEYAKIEEYEQQNRSSQELDQQPDEGGDAGEAEGGEGQVPGQPAAEETAGAGDEGQQPEGAEAGAGQPSVPSDDVPGGAPGGTIGRSLTEDEADDLIIESAARAEAIPEIELTPESWNAEFGNGVLTTPIGDVKISDNQYSKTVEKGRAREFGMIRPTLTNPDFIIEVDSEAKDGQSERPTSYLFVKAFIGKDGKKQYFFKSVTVQRDGMEVNVSNHFDRPKRVRESLEKGKLLYRFDGGAQTEQSPATVSVTTPQTNPGVESEDVIADLSEPDQSDAAADVSKPQTPGENGGETINAETQASSSEGKVTNNSSNNQEKSEKSSQIGKTSSPEQQHKRIVSDDQMEDLKKKLREKFGTLNAGIDVERMLLGAMYAVGKIERGVTKFADYAAEMVEEIGDAIRPYLKAFYEAVRNMPEAAEYRDQMDSPEYVASFDEYNFDKATAPNAFTKAEQVVQKQKAKRQVKKIEKEVKQKIQGGVQQLDLFGEQPQQTEQPDVKPSEQLKPTDLRDGIKPDTAELGAAEAKEKAQSQQHLQAVREKVKGLLEKYRSLAPVRVIDIDSDEEIRQILTETNGKEPTPEELKKEKKALKDSNLPAAYNPIKKVIYIFADKIEDDDDLEEGFFHENIHRGLHQYYGDGPIELAEAFWETVSPTNPEATRIRKEAVSNAYKDKPEDIKEEYFVHALGNQMVTGSAGNIIARLSPEHQEIINNILHNIGYDTAEETKRRKGGDDTLRSDAEGRVQEAGSESRGVTPPSADRIEDVGEEIAGARKDMTRKIAQSLDSATKQTLAELPFSKAYKKPDLKKAVEEGALRESDATFYDAFFSTFIDPNKPRVTQAEARRKKYIPDFRTNLEKWVDRTHQMLQTLKEFVEADEQQRDRMIESLLADKYPFRDSELAEIEKRKEWNKEKKDIVWGDKTTPNPLWITYEVMKQMGYSPGDKVDIPYGVLKSNSTGTGYSIRNKKDELMGYSFPKSVEEGIDAIVWLARLKRGDTDIQHPVDSFYSVPTKSQTAENGRYRVVYGSWRSPQSREFDSKEEADAFAAKKPGAQTVALREVVRRFGYKPMFRHPLTGERIAVNDKEFDTEAEARQYIEDNYEELNNDLNTQLSSQQKESSGKKELTADDLLYTAIVRGKDGKYNYAVLIDKKYANNYGMPLILKEGFASRDDAKAYADRVKGQVLKVYNDYKSKQKAFTYFDTGEDSRIGEDYRNGKDVTADDFMNAFGFRGVQFGNWTNQRDRQMAVNQAYDALLDLAKLIGVSPRALSLNGELGIAFGARGSGNASAHYEPGEIVINLTKTKGAGSLAHEWWHALDNYFARTAGEKGGMVTDDSTLPMRKELRDAYNTLVDQLKESNYYARSKNKGDYWGRMHEVTARLLSEWVDQQLKKRGELNTFLSRGAKTDGTMEMNYERYKAHAELAGKEVMPFEEYKKLDEAMLGSPYPSAQEVERFSAAMQNIFDVMQEREDEETGRVALYHKVDDSQAEAPKAEPGSQDTTLRDAIVELLQDAGIDVITDDAEGQRTLDKANGKTRQQFKTKDGQAYGYTYNGKIYLDPSIATAETPVHEYTHLWAEAVRQNDPKTWENIVDVLKNDPAVRPFWEKVAAQYPELTDENDIAEEVLAQYSGRRGSEKLREVADEIARENGGIFGRAQAVEALRKMKNILARFWKAVADVMGWQYSRADEIADKVLYDLLSGVRPETEGRAEVREQRVPGSERPDLNTPSQEVNEYNKKLERPDDFSLGKSIYMVPIKKTWRNYVGGRFREAWQDSMITLRRAQDIIAKVSGKPLQDYENAYAQENLSHGATKNEYEWFDRNLYKPLLKSFNALKKAMDAKDDAEVHRYMFAKHGLERNVVMAFRDAVKRHVQAAERDYESRKKAYDEAETRIKQKERNVENLEQLGFKEKAEEKRKELNRLKAAFERRKVPVKPQTEAEVHKAYQADEGRIQNEKDFREGRIDYRTYRERDDQIRAAYAPESYFILRSNDYSGLTGLFAETREVDGVEVTEKPGTREAEDMAMKLVDGMERQYGPLTDDLWQKVNGCTKWTLQKSWQSGMLSRESYDVISGMYDFYIPLRGWDGTNAQDVYDYVGGRSGVFSKAAIPAKGRTSVADNPIAYIGNMAMSNIIIGNQNRVKQCLLNLSRNHPNELLRPDKAWYENIGDENNPNWVAVTPDIPEDATPEEINQILDEFNRRMRQLKADGKATQTRGSLHISYPAPDPQLKEHEVRVLEGGNEYIVYVNGDPRVAQAVNGTRARKVRNGSGLVTKLAERSGRFKAAVYTSFSPAFVISNWFRDITMAVTSSLIDKGIGYNATAAKNTAALLNPFYWPNNIFRMMWLFTHDRLDMQSPTQRMFKEFMMAGGETGFIAQLDLERFKDNISKELGHSGQHYYNPKKVFRGYLQCTEFLNRCIEDSTRFIVYKTSRQQGESIQKSASDAKDVTLNFNRKGTGELGNAFMRGAYIFVNPSVQGIQTIARLVRNHPYKFTALAAGWIMGGAMQPYFNQMLMELLGPGDDDDRDAYWKLPEHVRRQCLVFYVGNGQFATIPLAQEFRALWGVGETASARLMGHGKGDYVDDGMEIVESFLDLLPLDVLGHGVRDLQFASREWFQAMGMNLVPDIIKTEVEGMANKDWSGKPLYKDTENNRSLPSFAKAYKGTPDWLVRSTEFLNEATGGEGSWKPGKVDWNPAIINHELQGWFGGPFNFFGGIGNDIYKAMNGKEVKIYDVPVLNRFVNMPSERDFSQNLGDEYWKMYREEYRPMDETFSQMKREARNGNAKALQAIENFFQSDDYKRYKEMKEQVDLAEKRRKAAEAGEGAFDFEYTNERAGKTPEQEYSERLSGKDEFEEWCVDQIGKKTAKYATELDNMRKNGASRQEQEEYRSRFALYIEAREAVERYRNERNGQRQALGKVDKEREEKIMNSIRSRRDELLRIYRFDDIFKKEE